MPRVCVPLSLVAVLALALGAARTARAEGEPPEPDRHGIWAEIDRTGTEVFADLGGQPDWYWDHGPAMETLEQNFTFHAGFELQVDTVWYSDMDDDVETAAGEKWSSGFSLRRFRLILEGSILKHWYWRVRYDLAPDNFAKFQDAYGEWMGLHDRLGNLAPRIRFGQCREPMSLDAMTAAKFTTFLERATAANAFAPLRNVGVRGHITAKDNRATAWLGLFAVNAANLADATFDDGVAVTGRVTWLPWAPKGRECRFLHVGVAWSWRQDSSSVQYHSTAGTNVGPNIVDTGQLDSREQRILQIESAYVRDRFSLQAEWFWTQVHLDPEEDALLEGGYLQASYFLTPPCRTFNRQRAAFARVHPGRSVTECGRGAWELAARYEYLDLDDSAVRGGVLHSWTAGINWYLTPYMRITGNYIFSVVENAYGVPDADGTMHTIGLRFQVDS